MVDKVNIVARLKEIVSNFEATMEKARDRPLNTDTRVMIQRTRMDTLQEITSLIKRL